MFKNSFTVLIGSGYWGSKILEKLIHLNLRTIVLENNEKIITSLKKNIFTIIVYSLKIFEN